MHALFPPSDHCDGQHFFNPGPRPQNRSRWQLLRWQMSGARAAWQPPPPDPVFAPPSPVVAPGSVAVSFVNHATFLIRLPGVVVLTDPIFSLRCSPVSWAGPKRARPPGIALADLPRPDVVLLSHNHYDHMDIPSLRELQRRHAPLVVTMLGNARILARHGIEARELDWWQETRIGALKITATPARHFSARSLSDRNRALWGGFMLDGGGGRILFAGDSAAGPHWDTIRARLGAPSLALLPIGAYEPRALMAAVHMNPDEAVQAHLALGATTSVGMHFGTFQLTDEAIDAPLHALEAARAAHGLAEDAFVTHGFGETRVYRFDRPV
jgi:L-ascorbate metabolism protein UlaG (beta-lactamase superfamily)